MVRPILALDRLIFLESEGKVGYRHGPDGAELERMDYLELIARVTSHIPDKGQVMVRYYGLYANAHRGKVRKAGRTGFPVRWEDESRCVPDRVRGRRPDHPSPGVDVRGRKAAARPCVRAGRPDGGQRERGL